MLHFGEEQGRAPIFRLFYVLFIYACMYIYLIYSNTNNFVESVGQTPYVFVVSCFILQFCK